VIDKKAENKCLNKKGATVPWERFVELRLNSPEMNRLPCTRLAVLLLL
jgi:hypothetical protein